MGTIVQRIDENLLADREDAALGRKLIREDGHSGGTASGDAAAGASPDGAPTDPGSKKLVRTEVCKPDASGKLSDVILSVFQVSDTLR